MTAETVRDAFAVSAPRLFGKVGGKFHRKPNDRAGVGPKYLAYSTVRRWEDRATEISGIRDKLEIQLDIYDVESGELLQSAFLKGTSSWLTDGGILREIFSKSRSHNLWLLCFREVDPVLEQLPHSGYLCLLHVANATEANLSSELFRLDKNVAWFADLLRWLLRGHSFKQV